MERTKRKVKNTEFMKDFRRLPECEELVMAIVWSAPEEADMETVRRIANGTHGRAWKPQTVSTFLARLREKGFLSMHRKGRYQYYVPAIAETDYRNAVVEGIVKRLYGGDRTELKKDLE